MTEPAKLNPALIQAIDEADTATLKALLKSICERSREYSPIVIATEKLLVGKSHAKILSVDEIRRGGGGGGGDNGGRARIDSFSNEPPQAKRQKRDGDDEHGSITPGDKVLVSRYTICHKCHQKYDVVTNNKRACDAHPGDLEPKEGRWEPGEVWPDRILETDLRFKDNPDEFTWNCCYGSGYDYGCVKDFHGAPMTEC